MHPKFESRFKTMRNIIILSVIAVLCSCNQASSSQDSGSDTNATTTDNASDVPVEMIENPSTAADPKALPGEMPEMTFKTKDHDFGDIVENQDVETTYEFTNTGKADLLISDCRASCGCTVPDWPKTPIKPGQKGVIKVRFNSAGKAGVNNKIVTVVSNTKEGNTELKFRANVQAAKPQE